MGIYSGKFGAANGVSTLRQWSINETAESKPYVASNTQQGTGRRRGNIDWTGQYNAFGGQPAFMPGEVFEFGGFTAPSSGANGATYTGDAIVDSVNINVNYESADPIGHTVNFGGDGELVVATGLYEDDTFPDVPSPIGLPFEYTLLGGSASWAEMCVQNLALSISCPSKTYVNSCTAGRVGRKPGAAVDWSLQIGVQNEDFAALPFEKGDYVGFRVYTGETEYWELLWGIIENFSNLVVNRETGDIISMSINVAMAGFDHDAEEVGHILKPDGTTYWPESGS